MYYLFFLFCSLVAAVPLEKRQDRGDVKLLVNNLKETISHLGQGALTSDLSKAITDIVAIADVIIASAGANADKSQFDQVISGTIKTIKNHAKTGKISASLMELSRAISLLSDLSKNLTLFSGDNEKLYQAAAAVKATGQAILESLHFVGEDLISYNFSQKESLVRSAELIKRSCWGISLFSLCVG